jgi:hypothetical protein
MTPYTLSNLKAALRHPIKLLKEINRLYYTNFRTWEYNRDAPNIFGEDWDNLLILDACRYDAFEQSLEETTLTLPGELDVAYSRGASTREFLGGNLRDIDLSDTVYVTGTTMLYRNTVVTSKFEHNLHDIVDVWEDAIEIEEWGVRPERMAEAARRANERYPDKRLVVHFIQPHIPFIGDFGQQQFGSIEGSIWRKQRRGELNATDDNLWQAYMENLHTVLPIARDLLVELPGKNVITADHGQLIGDRGFPVPIKDYGHPNGIYADELVKVPWHVYQNGDRKRIVSESPGDNYGTKDRSELDQKAEDHLRNLGYLE